MAHRNFGVGKMWALGSDGTITEAGDCQEISLDIERSTKEFRGSDEFPLEIRTTQGKVGGKIKMAQIKASFIASVYGTTPSPGMRRAVTSESTGPIAAATYPAKNPTGFRNYGVRDDLGNWMVKVASAPTDGQYSVDPSGVYTFASSASGKIYFVRYNHSLPEGFTTSITNSPMGSATFYLLDMFNWDAMTQKNLGFTAYRAIIPKFSLPMKNEDFTIYDLDYSCMADETRLHPVTGKPMVLDVYTSE